MQQKQVDISKSESGAIIGTVEIVPHGQQKVFIGEHTSSAHYPGYSVGFVPDPDPDNAVVSHITVLEQDGVHRLFMHIANFGVKSTTATIRRM